jgi:ribosome-associated translation inhibitor RaiA
MQIGINSDRNIQMHARLAGLIEANLHRTLDRFNSRLTRIEVHLTDENGDKSRGNDKRCVLEARTKRRPSVTVTNDSTDIQTAVSGAAGKMERLLEATFGRIEDKHRDLTTRQSGAGQNLVLKPELS